MKAIGGIQHPECKISLFDWNQKYLVKIEQGMCEQTFKVSHFDVADEAALRAAVTPAFIEKALSRFASMHESINEIL
jgi:hypothetical protein